MKIAAIVVTYNRLELLKKALAAVEAQERALDLLVIVDNASTDGTADYLASRPYRQATKVRTMKENTGGAGGFFAGMSAAYEAGADAMWIMDDDTAPRPDALGELENALVDATDFYGAMPAYASSLVVWAGDGEACQMNFPTAKWGWVAPLARGKSYTTLDCTSFVSCLVTREAIEACGFPYPEYFIWFDDAEYTYRLSKWRPGIFVPSSVADHMMPANSAAFWGEVNDSSLWKYAYGARNQVSAGLSLRRLDILASLAQNLIAQVGLNRDMPLHLKFALLKAACSGLVFQPKRRFPAED